MKHLLPILPLVGLSASLQAQTLINFNSTGDLAANFAGYASGTQFVNVASGGLGATGFVSMNPSASSNYAVHQSSVNATSFSNAIVGGYFLYDGTTFSSRPISFGFTSSATDVYSGSLATTGTDIRVALNGANSGTNAGIILSHGGVAVDTSASNVTLVAGNWYYMQLSIGGVSGGSFTGVQAELFNSSNTGTIGTSLKVLNNGGSGYSIVSSLTGDASVHAFFGGIGPGSRGIDGVDNFTFAAIPEPSSFTAIAGVWVLCMVSLRRKLRA